MKKVFLVVAMAFCHHFVIAQSQIITTGNNVINSSSPFAADIVIGSDAGTRHHASIMWWSNASASRISNNNDIFYFSVWNSTSPNAGISAFASGTSYFQGNLAVGTTDTRGYKLAVNGSMIATSVQVMLNSAWPDYVFKSTYQLKPLSEVKAYIDKNQHLPEMPSAAEVEKDGLNLGEMNKLLTQKVEELTLYLIEQKKQSDAQIESLQNSWTR